MTSYKQEVKEKMEQVKKAVRERAKEQEGLGEEIEKVHKGGPLLGPRDKQEFDDLVKEIEEQGKEFKDEDTA